MGFIGYRIFNTLDFNGEPILASINPRPHYYKFFGPICNGASPRAYGNCGGFYAFKDHRYMMRAFGLQPRLFNYTWAEVELFGEVIEHQFGYRSSKLMFNHIYVPRHKYINASKQIVMMERRYQCDVTFGDEKISTLY